MLWTEPLERARALEAVGPYLSSPHARGVAVDLAGRIDRAETRATTQRRLLERLAAHDDVTAEELETLLAHQDDGSGATIVARAAARQGDRSVLGTVAPRVARQTSG